MAEVTFVKSFLAALDGRPLKLSPDHVEDPKTYQTRSAYILPKMPKAMSKRKGARLTPGQERSLAVTVTSIRNPPFNLKLSSQDRNTSVHDIKAIVAKETGILEDKIKILHKKKPVPDSKVLRDLVAEDDQAIDFSVMVIGGGSSATMMKPESQQRQQGLSGAEVLRTEEFWNDLKSFLLQRTRDEQVAAELMSTFQSSWKGR
ncbi:cell-cycle control medial ring component-domain-containing protein [Xylariaceae sp. FL0594]|nr:cell-cycle control medial ring component-domain-containing protein [Xylariaceae sp. FL0594]